MLVRTIAVISLCLANCPFLKADVIASPSQLHQDTIIQTFESYSVGTSLPLSFGIATLSSNINMSVQAPAYSQWSGIFEGKWVGASGGAGQNFYIDFSTPVSQFGMGILDVNLDGNVLRALDVNNNVLESVTSSSTNPDFPTGSSGGGYSLFIGFVRNSNDIARIELLPTANDYMGIDTVSYYVTAIPEPNALALCLPALGLFLAKRRRPRH